MLVPGDIVELSEGNKVPADMRLLQINTSNFQITQANFTGESKPSYKTSDIINKDEMPGLKDRDNTAFSSSGVVSGSAKGIVIATGIQIFNNLRNEY